MSRIAAILMTCIATLAAHAQEASILSPPQLEERAAQFVVFVPPEYPREAAAAGVASEVDVLGEVGVDGTFAVTKVASTSAEPAFEAAVRAAARFWTLRPGYGADCVPRPAPAQVRIWFEMKDGKPTISFGQARAQQTAGKALEVTHRRNPEYPRPMLTRGISGDLEVLMRVGTDGRVEEMELVPGPVTRLATRDVATTMRQWRFEPRPAEEGPVCVSYVITFQMQSGFSEGRMTRPVRPDGAN